MNETKKAKLLELFSEALDKNEYVTVHFGQYDKKNDYKPVLLEDVATKVHEYSVELDYSVNHLENEEVANSYLIEGDNVSIVFCYLTQDQIKAAEEEDDE